MFFENLWNFFSYYWYFFVAGIILIAIIIIIFAWKPKKVSQGEKTLEQYYCLYYDKRDKLWEVKKSTNNKATKRFIDKENAIKFGKQIAEKNNLPFREE